MSTNRFSGNGELVGKFRIRKRMFFDIASSDGLRDVHITIPANSRFFIYDNGYYFKAVSATKSFCEFIFDYDKLDKLFETVRMGFYDDRIARGK